MDRERLTRLLAQPGPMEVAELDALRHMTERYPWFSGAHLLLALGDHASGSVMYEEQLQHAAAHLPSRAILHGLVHPGEEGAQTLVPTQPVPPHVAVPEAAPGTAAELNPIATAPAPSEASTVAAPPPEHAAPNQDAPAPARATEAVESKVDSASGTDSGTWLAAPTPIIVPVEPTPTPPPPPVTALAPEAPEEPEEIPAADHDELAPEPDPLDQLIRDSALASSYSLRAEDFPELPPPAAAAPAVPPPPPATEAPPVTPTVAPVQGRLRFTQWLEMAPPPEVAAVVPDPEPTPEAPLPEPTPAFELTPPAKPVTESPSPDTKAIIDRFIQRTAPPPPTRKAEFFTPQQAAKRSLEDHNDMVSETLARIHAAQGNTAKAIAAYQRLAERFPEQREHYLALAASLAKR